MDCISRDEGIGGSNTPNNYGNGNTTVDLDTAPTRTLLESLKDTLKAHNLRQTFIDEIGGVIPSNESGPPLSRADQAIALSASKNIVQLTETASRAYGEVPDIINNRIDALSRTGSAESNWWLTAQSWLTDKLMDSAGKFTEWAHLNFPEFGKSLTDNSIVQALQLMRPKIHAEHNSFVQSIRDNYFNPCREIADRLGMDAQDVAIMLGDGAIYRHTEEANAEAIRRWETLRDSEQMSKNPDTKLIHELERNIARLKANLDNPYPIEPILSGTGYTNAEAKAGLESLYKQGFTPDEVKWASDTLRGLFQQITMRRAEMGLIDPDTVRRFPGFENYVMVRTRGQNLSGSINEGDVFNPGYYHERGGIAEQPDSAFASLLYYAGRASKEIGSQDFGRMLYAASQAKENTGLIVRDYDNYLSLMHSRDPNTQHIAKALANDGAIIVDVPTSTDGEITGRKKVVLAFDHNYKLGTLNGTALNDALFNPIKASDNLLTKATGLYGQMFTRFRAMFAPFNFSRDTSERMFHLAGMTAYDTNGNTVKGISLIPSYMYNVGSAAKALLTSKTGTLDPNSKLGMYLQEFNESGVRQLFFPGMMDKDVRGSAAVMMKRMDVLRRDLNSPAFASMKRTIDSLGDKGRKALEVIDGWNDYWNNIAPLSQYITLRDAGLSVKDAQTQTLKSLNLYQRGKLTPLMEMFFPFVRSTIQSAAATARSFGLSYDPRGVLLPSKNAWIFGTGSAITLMMLKPLIADSLGIDEKTGKDNFDLLPFSVITSSIPIGIGKDENGVDEYIKLPFIGYGAPRIIAAVALGYDRVQKGLMTPDEYASEVLFSMGKNLMPGNWPEFSMKDKPAEWLTMMFSPSLAQPFIMNASNINRFGNKLYYEPNDEFTARALSDRMSTPQIFKDGAKLLLKSTGWDIAPGQIKNAADFFNVGPIALLTSIFDNSARKYGAEESVYDQSAHNPMLQLMGGTMSLGNTANIERSMFYRVQQHLAAKVRRSGVKLTSTVYGNDKEKRIEYQTQKLREAGFTPSEIEDYFILDGASTQIQNTRKDLKKGSYQTWLQSDNSELLRMAYMELAKQEQRIYGNAIKRLNHFKQL